MSDDAESINYSSYLALDDLLNAQHLQSARSGQPEHDELLFIVIHQVYELWFKQLLHELDFVMERLAAGQLGSVLHTLKRVRAILKTVVSQVDVLETMTPLEFSSFRDRLASSSGLQSYQFRELECILGLKNPAVLTRYEDGSTGHQHISRRLVQPTVWDGFIQFLRTRSYALPEAYDPPNVDVQAVLIDIYRNDPELTQLCEALTDVDEGLQEWRYRHVKMVQRTIGTKMGTGGTDGVDYLMQTLNTTLFPDLWAVRANL